MSPSIVSSQRLADAFQTKTALAPGQRTVAELTCAPPAGTAVAKRKPTSLAFAAPGARRSSSGPLPKKLYGAGRLKSRR